MTDWVLNFPTLDIATLRAVHKSIDAAYKTFSRNYGDAIESAFDPLLWLLIRFEWILLNAPWWVIVLAIAGICYAASRRVRLSLGVIVAFLVIGVLGMWEDTMRTLAIIFVAHPHRHRHRHSPRHRHVAFKPHAGVHDADP